MAASDGRTIDGYTLGAPLGAGASADVLAATDARGRPVAIKRLRRSAREDPTGTERLLREAEVLRGLDHPGLVRVLGAGRDPDDHPYLVLERVDGRSLRARLDDEGALAPQEAWRIVREVALALRAAHAAGVLHRDLTPSNVLLDARARAKLGDFGLARRTDDPRLSREGASTGTPAYMAPEQWWGAAVDERTDVYGLGAVLYECLGGAPPWRGEPADVLHRIATAEPPPLAARVPAEGAAFVRRALARDPRERPADVARFIAEGDRAFAHARAHVPWLALALGGLVLASAVALGFGGSHDPRVWIHESGVGGLTTLACAALALSLGARRASWRPLLEALPLFAGALAFLTGMAVVSAHVSAAAPEERFAFFHYGLAEASAGWFLGAALSAALFAAGAARLGPDERVPRPGLRAVLAACACVLAAALAWEPGAAAVAALAIGLTLSGAPSRGADAALCATMAVASYGLMAWVRLESAAARVWDEGLSRAARAEVITRLDAAEDATWVVTGVAVVALAASAEWRGVRAWPRRRVLARSAVAIAALGALAGPWLVAQLDRRALTDALAPHFSVWRELDPPAGAGDGPARLGPTLQLGRRRIALDGRDLAPLAALDGRTGPRLVAQALGPRVELGGPGPELVLAVDRSIAWRRVERALAAAADLGVRRVDVVTLPGAMPRLAPSAPAAARLVLARDLAAFEARLELDGRERLPAGARFEEVARALAARDARALPVAPLE
ncbi:MAG: serine/threonine protein kinase [Sandaracinaceae bacterium]|nr:serine/threonine protein kinase [Sandaracinaceae bacterium]